ncbi:MAG TPA: o-succinylbenzoate synthase [Longimicrobiales bacterium]|nr:o-succinylbenzoate synthase [Longimicrobiales bacterium]
MKIERAVLREVPLDLIEPFETSHGTVRRRRVLLLTLHAEGLEAWAECVAGVEPSYTYETTETAWHVLTEFVLPRLVGLELDAPGSALEPFRWIRGHPMALAAVEMAAWDLAARAANVPLAKLLGGERDSVPVGVSIGLKSSIAALEDRVARALAEGYARVKLKIEPGRDVETLARVRERFPDASLMADANSAYTLDDVERLGMLDALDLEMIEQPFAHDDFLDHARLQERIRTPVCLDESIGSERDARLALALHSCRVVNLKPGRVGGLTAGKRIHDMMVAAGVPVWCGGMLESGVGRAHNLALASLPGFTLPGDISASRRYWERDIVAPELEVAGGLMAVPTGTGIGVEVDAERVEALSVRVASYP